jgi:hypothetical protein
MGPMDKAMIAARNYKEGKGYTQPNLHYQVFCQIILECQIIVDVLILLPSNWNFVERNPRYTGLHLNLDYRNK